jgi:hypothetical protein
VCVLGGGRDIRVLSTPVTNYYIFDTKSLYLHVGLRLHVREVWCVLQNVAHMHHVSHLICFLITLF